MASNIDAYFFKAENSTLTLEKIRNQGFLAGDTDNGFIEVTFNQSLDHWVHRLANLKSGHKNFESQEEQEDKWKLKQEELETFLIKGLKDGTPRLMRCASSSFGGCMDDRPILIAYNLDGTIEKTKDNYQEDSKAEELFLKEYNISGYYDTVGFSRHTSDLQTEEQEAEVKLLEKEFDDMEYKKWKDSQPDLSIARIALLAVVTARKGRSRYSYSENEYDNLDFMERFIKEYYNIQDVNESTE